MVDSRVTAAMRAVDRHGFLPPDQQEAAGGDFPLPIGHGQTSSQPSTVAAMLDLLDVREGLRVLDVGAGSGWTTALLAWLVGSSGLVLGVEIDPEIARWGAANVERQSMPWASLRLAREGVLGWPEEAPYDRVLVSAGARRMPRALVEQVGPGGAMVVVVSGVMRHVRRSGDGEPTVTKHGHYRFVPLR